MIRAERVVQEKVYFPLAKTTYPEVPPCAILPIEKVDSFTSVISSKYPFFTLMLYKPGTTSSSEQEKSTVRTPKKLKIKYLVISTCFKPGEGFIVLIYLSGVYPVGDVRADAVAARQINRFDHKRCIVFID